MHDINSGLGDISSLIEAVCFNSCPESTSIFSQSGVIVQRLNTLFADIWTIKFCEQR